MNLSGQLHAPAALSDGNNRPYITGYGAGYAPVSGWKLWKRESLHYRRKFNQAVRSLSTTLWHVDPLLGNGQDISKYTTAVTKQTSMFPLQQLDTIRLTAFSMWSVQRCCKEDKPKFVS
jgi:hypothetical protein